MHKGKLLCKLLIVLSHVGLPLSGLKWHERIMRNSRLLLPIVGWGKWSIVLNRSDFSCCDGGNSLILALLEDLLICLYFLRKYMKYLVLSILAIRAVGCLFRGKILCQRFASSWFEFSYNTRSKPLFCAV